MLLRMWLNIKYLSTASPGLLHHVLWCFFPVACLFHILLAVFESIFKFVLLKVCYLAGVVPFLCLCWIVYQFYATVFILASAPFLSFVSTISLSLSVFSQIRSSSLVAITGLPIPPSGYVFKLLFIFGFIHVKDPELIIHLLLLLGEKYRWFNFFKWN